MITSHTLNARRKQSGITLIEVSIGLIIAAIVAAAAFIAFQNNARRTEVQDNIKQITEIISESKQKVGSTSGYIGYTEAVAAQLAILNVDGAGAPLPNSYNGNIVILGSADGNTSTLQWNGVEGDQCSDIVLAVANGVTNITSVGDGVVAGDVDVVNGQIDLGDATTLCGGGDETIALTFTFGRR
ncbi:type 4 pilus major pilin [Limnobacter sp.]|jgi:prepilin-type N-terminal cleavage/methylation domain-containing protein|uniref:type 4 pilus major pilin n=1 Tax=Limnobacter sp. TaxID=2003368 RepID=UPI003BA8A213